MRFRATICQAKIMERMAVKHLSQETIQEILDVTQTKEEIKIVEEYLKETEELTDQEALEEIKWLLGKRKFIKLCKFFIKTY